MNSRRRWIVAAACIVGLASPDAARAQGAPPLGDEPRRERPALVPGDIVRVTAPRALAEPLEGRVIGVRSDSLILEASVEVAGPTAIPLSSITSLEVKRDPSGVIGGVFGVLFGGVFGATAAGELAEGGSSLVRNLAVVGGASVGVLGGYFAGSTIDKSISGPRWVDVPVWRLQAGIGPAPDSALGLHLTYSF